jgi:putative transposase
VCYNTLLRAIAREGLLPKTGRSDVRKRFEHEEVNELWVGDFLHGPTVMAHNRLAKAILCALIDDHSRIVVGYKFSVHETVSVLVEVLKEAFSTYGLSQRLYVDNGSAFSSDLLVKSCAQAGVSLIHSKPYDSPSRGKIERFFRTVRERFFSGLPASLTLEELNEAFARWLREDYHYKVHSGIEQRPIDRYQASVSRVSIRRLSKAELDEIFLVRHERIVGNDATISFKGRIYEVPGAYIRQRIEIRHPVDDAGDLTLYDNGARIARLKLVDVRENARTFRPASAPSPVSYARGKVQR